MASDGSMSQRSDWVDDRYAEGNIGVFWDVVDYPIPESDPDLISNKIKSALAKSFYRGPVSTIHLYEDDEKTLLVPKQEVIDKYEAAGITFNFVPEVPDANGCARVHKMFVDLLFWALASPNHPATVILLSKHLKEQATINILHSLDSCYINVLLSELASDEVPFRESSEWLSHTFCQGLSSHGGGSSQRVDNKRKHPDTDVVVVHPEA